MKIKKLIKKKRKKQTKKKKETKKKETKKKERKKERMKYTTVAETKKFKSMTYEWEQNSDVNENIEWQKDKEIETKV